MPSFLETSMEIAREAGALLSRYFEQRVTYELKGEFDLVTEADRASEQLVVERLRSHFPTHSIVAEEGGGRDAGSEYRWYVDPLDGTTNFAHGFPMFNVTLALERAGEMIAGCIYDPAARRDVRRRARRRRLVLTAGPSTFRRLPRLEEALVATGFPSRKRHLNVNVHFFYQMAMFSQGARRAGSAALDLAYVACGRLDAFWEFGLKPWDMAAGSAGRRGWRKGFGHARRAVRNRRAARARRQRARPRRGPGAVRRGFRGPLSHPPAPPRRGVS